jgi:hypothetical protein
VIVEYNENTMWSLSGNTLVRVIVCVMIEVKGTECIMGSREMETRWNACVTVTSDEMARPEDVVCVHKRQLTTATLAMYEWADDPHARERVDLRACPSEELHKGAGELGAGVFNGEEAFDAANRQAVKDLCIVVHRRASVGEEDGIAALV